MHQFNLIFYEKKIILKRKEIFKTTKENLWNALTDLNLMKQWYFKEINFFEPKIGSKTLFSIEYEGKKFTHKSYVFEVIPKEKIAYHWQYEECAGDSTVTFELKEVKYGILLTLTARILDPFPEMKEFSYESMNKGWETLLKVRLKQFVEHKIH